MVGARRRARCRRALPVRAARAWCADHEDGLRHLPLRVALRLGATRLLWLSLAWTALALVGLLVVGNAVGLSR